MLKLVDSHPQAALLLKQAAQKLETLRRLLQACQQALQEGQPDVAYRHWQQAREISPHAPELAELAQAIARTLSAGRGSHSQAVELTERSQRFVLDDLALVVSDGEVVVGTPRAEGVHLPIVGPLPSRHAVFLRDRHGWQLVPCRDRHGQVCPVWAGEHKLEDARRLVDGCQIQLGGRECTWRFRLPVPGSATAMLEPLPGTPVRISAGRYSIDRVVLLEQELRLCPVMPAHLVMPDLPCQQLVVHWSQGRLSWEIEGGIVRVEVPGRALELADSRLFLPCRLIIEPQLDEGELLGREVAGCGVAPQRVLEIKDSNFRPT